VLSDVLMPKTSFHSQLENYVHQKKNYQQKCNFSSYLKYITKLLTHTQEQQFAGPGSHWFG